VIFYDFAVTKVTVFFLTILLFSKILLTYYKRISSGMRFTAQNEKWSVGEKMP